MPKKTKNNDLNVNKDITVNNYHSSYDDENSQLQKGLAETHEQVSDQFTEGTIDQLIDK